MAIKTTTTSIQAMIHVAALSDLPARPSNGDQFQFEFSLSGKKFNFAVGRSDQVAATAGVVTDRGQVDGTTNAQLKVSPTFDKSRSTVLLAIDRAALESVAGVPIPVGTTLSAVKAMTKAFLGNKPLDADSAQSLEVADQTYIVGDNLCFFPPPALMEWLGDDTLVSQYGDLVEATVVLTSDAGDTLAGATVNFILGAARVSAVTDADGLADAFLPALGVGATKVTASFAGDLNNYRAVLDYPVRVSPEVTRLTLVVTRVGTARTVTGTLVDDDLPSPTALSGRSVTVLVNGKKSASLKTDMNGKAVYKAAKVGQTVTFTAAAMPGKYAASSAQQKIS